MASCTAGETVFGGGCDWGYIVHYGNRVGGNYQPGGNSSQPAVPASYKSQKFLGQFGFDLSPDSNVEFRYRRLDDTNTQYALQFFDVDYMGADAYSVHYNWEDPCGSGTLSAMGWYSRSRMNGDTDPATRLAVRHDEPRGSLRWTITCGGTNTCTAEHSATTP